VVSNLLVCAPVLIAKVGGAENFFAAIFSNDFCLKLNVKS
jgi:hypothetical protein